MATSFFLARDPGQVLFVALAVGGVAALAKALSGASSTLLVIPFGLIACATIYVVHDRRAV